MAVAQTNPLSVNSKTVKFRDALRRKLVKRFNPIEELVADSSVPTALVWLPINRYLLHKINGSLTGCYSGFYAR